MSPSQWLVSEPGNGYAIANSWWIKTSSATFSLDTEDGAASRKLITVSEEDGNWTVCFDATLIDAPPRVTGTPVPPEPPPPDFKKLCAMHVGAINGLGFLHLPLEKGRASLSVFAQPSSTSASTGDVAVLPGAGNQPLMMASIEWQVAAGATNLKFNSGAAEPPIVSPTSASPTTLLNWTRTGKNFELWHASKDGKFVPYSVSNVVARWNANGHACAFVDSTDGNQLNFEPPSGRYPNPLYVHRHHANIATGNAPGIGRPAEVWKAAFRTFGGAFSAPKDAQAVRLVEFETPARPLAWFPAGMTNSALNSFPDGPLRSFLHFGRPQHPAYRAVRLYSVHPLARRRS